MLLPWGGFVCPRFKSPFFEPAELRSIYGGYECHEQHYELPPGEAESIAAKVERIERFAAGRGRLLEIGCGRGHLLSRTLQRGWDAFGVELEGSARDNLLPEVRDHVLFIRSESDFTQMSASSYDVICSYQVFEHLLSPVDCIRHWTRCLAPGGLLIIDTPNAGSLGARVHRQKWVAQTRREHFVLFSGRALERLYRIHGLEVLRKHYGGPPAVCSRGASAGSRARRLFRRPSLSRILRTAIHRFGLGDNIEIIGRKRASTGEQRGR